MYQNVYHDNRSQLLHLWDDKTGYQKINYKKKVYVPDEDGEFQTIDGRPLKKVLQSENDSDEFYGGDVPAEVALLIDRYGLDTTSPKHNTIIFDIETETNYKLPDIMNPENRITGISYYSYKTEKYNVFILADDFIESTKDNYVINVFEEEAEMLETFVKALREEECTILTGWNIDGFDIPYLIRRMEKICKKSVDLLSPIKKVMFDNYQKKFVIAGVTVLDYMLLYKKFNYGEETNFRLETIAQKELGRGKVEYEGTLNDLYENDKEKFIEYNVTDVELIQAIDKKRKLIDLAVSICVRGKIQTEDIFSSSKYIDGAILSFLLDKKIVAPNRKPAGKSKKSTEEEAGAEPDFEGAYVKETVTGLYKNVFDLDLVSLYPSIIMSLNISPETKIAKVVSENWDYELFAVKIEEEYTIHLYKGKKTIERKISKSDLQEIIHSNGYSISANGVIYKNISEYGIIPTILKKWFDERVEYKNLMKKYGKENDKEKYEYYEKLQNVQKVLLNTVYGVLGLASFRFYDLDNAEAVTISGQKIIRHSEYKLNEYYNNLLKTNKDYVIAIDTDSLFCSLEPILENPTMEEILDCVTKVQTYINDSYDDFVKKYFNLDKHLFKIKQELICSAGLFVAKKRYALNVVNKEGVTVQKLLIKGLDVIRSSFPAGYKNILKRIIIDILAFTPKVDIDSFILGIEKKVPFMTKEEIAKNTSVNNMKTYLEKQNSDNIYYEKQAFSKASKGTPVHVKASMCFNSLLEHNEITNIPKIDSGEKIKWVYLKRNPYRFDAIAFRGYDDPKVVIDFVDKYIDKQRMYESELKSKIEKIFVALKWSMPSYTQAIFNEFFN